MPTADSSHEHERAGADAGQDGPWQQESALTVKQVKLRYKLLVLVTLSLLAHALVIARTVVVARDGMGFIRTAQILPYAPWQAMDNDVQPPLYAVFVLATHTVLSPIIGGSTPVSWVFSAQATSTLFSILTVILLYFVARDMFDERLAWVAGLLYVLLPEVTKIGSDAVTDMSCLFWLLLALWLGVKSVQRKQLRWAAVAGLAAGLAYLTRPEGLAAALVIAGGLLSLKSAGGNVSRRWRVLAVLALVPGIVIATAPYVAATGSLSRKFGWKPVGPRWAPASSQPGQLPSFDAVEYPHVDDVEKGRVDALPPSRPEPVTGGLWATVLPGRLFAIPIGPPKLDWARLVTVGREFVAKMGIMLHLGLWPFTVLGLVLCIKRKTRLVEANRPITWYFGAYMFLAAAMAISVRLVGPYLSKRHLLPLATLSTVYSAVGLVEALGWFVRWRQRRLVRPGGQAGLAWASWPPGTWIAACLVVLAVPSVWEMSVPIVKRKDHKILASRYLRDHSLPGQRVATCSPWIGFYADRPYISLEIPSLKIRNETVAPFLLECKTEWLAIVVLFDEKNDRRMRFDHYQQTVRNTPRLVKDVPPECIRLQKKFPSVPLPDFVEDEAERSPRVQIRECLWHRQGQPFQFSKANMDASGGPVTDALLYAAFNPGVTCLVCGPASKDVTALQSEAAKRVQEQPTSIVLPVNETSPSRVQFANGSVVEFRTPEAGDVLADRAWIDRSDRLTAPGWLALQHCVKPTGTFTFYYSPDHVVYVYRVNLERLSKAWEALRLERRQAARAGQDG